MSQLIHSVKLEQNQNLIPEKNKVKIITDLLGPKIVLVPVRRGTKIPIGKGWTALSEQDMLDPNHLYLLQQSGNIAALLGASSGHLCSIDFDNSQQLEKFLKLNPGLRFTLRTKAKRGCNLWIRITSDDYPPTSHLVTKSGEECGEWRSSGSLTLIHGIHPSGLRYIVENYTKPLDIKFSDIHWPEDFILPWVSDIGSSNLSENPELNNLMEEFGVPFFFSKEGNLSGFNERFWASLFAAENEILFEPNHGQFYLYSAQSGLWKKETSERIREFVAKLILRCSRNDNHLIGEKLLTKNRLDSVLSALKGITENSGAFESKSSIIHVANGVIRFNEIGEIEFGSPKPEDYSRNLAPFSYDKDAKCPRFLSELIRVAMNQEDESLLQRWFGLALFGSNKPQRLLLLEGTAGGGKSRIALIAKGLIGYKNICQLRTDCLNERFETSRYNGKTLLMGPDVPGHFLNTKGASMIKSLVGGDPISAEAKGLNTVFELNGDFNILLTCNSRLRVRLDGDHSAWRRRLLVISFKEKPPKKKIPDFDKVLLNEEGSGILNWALEGFQGLLKELGEIGDFRLTNNQQIRTDILLSESDSLREFLGNHVEKSSLDDVTSDELKESYASYCISQEWDPLPIRTIERQLPDLMLELFQTNKSNSIKRSESRSLRGYRGVRLKETYGSR